MMVTFARNVELLTVGGGIAWRIDVLSSSCRTYIARCLIDDLVSFPSLDHVA